MKRFELIIFSICAIIILYCFYMIDYNLKQYRKYKAKIPKIETTIKQKEIILRATAFHMTKNDYKIYKINPEYISKTRYVALSRELLDSLNLKRGDTIMVSSPFFVNGRWKILSVTNKRVKNTIDFLFPYGQKCFLGKSKIIINYE